LPPEAGRHPGGPQQYSKADYPHSTAKLTTGHSGAGIKIVENKAK